MGRPGGSFATENVVRVENEGSIPVESEEAEVEQANSGVSLMTLEPGDNLIMSDGEMGKMGA